MGAASGEGEQAYNVARNASILAGSHLGSRHDRQPLLRLLAADDPDGVPRHQGGEGDTYVAAGVEAVSRDGGRRCRVPSPQLDGSAGSLANVYIPMGLTAENVAEREGITREEQDEWAVVSQNRAVEAQASGHFDAEIVRRRPSTRVDDGNEVTSRDDRHEDDGPRPGTTIEKLAQLKPAFKPDGTVTAGNACPLNDGAAAVLVMSRGGARELGLTPRARIIASAVGALEPEFMGLGPIPADAERAQAGRHDDGGHRHRRAQRGVRRAGRPVPRSVGISDEQLNPFGGAIALGHPFGMTGARIMTTLLNDLETLDGDRPGDDVRRRRHGPGHDRRAPVLIV